jgi:uncharacterized DUF497 family protein
MNYNFEWDFNKAQSNIIKHRITFENASSVFKDTNAISIFDEEYSQNEDRWITIGLDLQTRTLVTINKNNCNIRIISARKATKNEKDIYNGE